MYIEVARSFTLLGMKFTSSAKHSPSSSLACGWVRRPRSLFAFLCVAAMLTFHFDFSPLKFFCWSCSFFFKKQKKGREFVQHFSSEMYFCFLWYSHTHRLHFSVLLVIRNSWTNQVSSRPVMSYITAPDRSSQKEDNNSETQNVIVDGPLCCFKSINNPYSIRFILRNNFTLFLCNLFYFPWWCWRESKENKVTATSAGVLVAASCSIFSLALFFLHFCIKQLLLL